MKTKDSINRTNDHLQEQKKHLVDINDTMSDIVKEMDRISSFSWWTPPNTLMSAIFCCFIVSFVLLAIPYILEYYNVDLVGELGIKYQQFKIWSHESIHGHSSGGSSKSDSFVSES